MALIYSTKPLALHEGTPDTATLAALAVGRFLLLRC